ncbi:MAG: hypothetical protein FWC68_00815 [Oscillospiraceae bacterium]|nr:hypothetical protein [Oscillospiraceae bacterium]
MKKSLIDLKIGFGLILRSKRLKSLFLINSTLWGLISLTATYQIVLLNNIEVPAYYIGIILAFLEFSTGRGSKKATLFNKKFKNRSLTYVGLLVSVSTLVAGLAAISRIPFAIIISIIIICYTLRAIAKGLYSVLTSRYLSNFTDSENITQIFAANGITNSIGRTVVNFIGAQLLLHMSIEHAMLWIGITFSILILLIAKLIKNKVGHAPKILSS